ncbi:MAG: type II secretion system protein GspL [Deltaproteobacteria bacterium]|nr:type II secretion system protein GspL [Deltaproteobacteria bacterium]
MTEKILGIDIGNSALKAVLVSNSLRAGFRVEMAENMAFDDSGAIAGSVAQALASLGEKIDYRQVRINLSLPANAVSFHNVKLPFREEKKIRQTIAFELETMLPQGMDDSLLDYNIIRQFQHSDHHSEILAAVVPRAVVQGRLALFGENPPEINVIGIATLAVASLLATRKALTGSGLLLDVGAGQTVAVFLKRDKILQVRRYNFGEALLARKNDSLLSSRPEGEVSAAGRHSEQGPDDKAAGGACRKLCQELANTMEFMQWGGSMEDGLERIILTGGGSLQRGLKEEMARSFSLPVETMDVAESEGVTLPEGIREAWQPVIMNQALALAIHRPATGRGFNFPLQKSAGMANRTEFSLALKRGAAVLACAVFLLAMDSYLDYRYARLRLDNLKKEISAVFKGASPEITRIVDPVQQLKVKIAEARKISAGLGGMEGSATVLDLLKDISALAPPPTELLITGFNLDDDRLTIKGTVKNFDAVDALKRELAKSKYFTDLQIGATNLVKQGDKVEFDLRMKAQR